MKIPRTHSLLAVLSLVCLAAGVATATPARERTIERTIPAADAREISLKARVGEIRVETGSSDAVVVRLRLKPKEYGGWFLGRHEGDPEKADLKSETRGSTLYLDLSYPDDRDGLEEHWSLEVPARVAARLSLSVGDIHLRGVSGGVHLRVNVGDIEAEIPEGDVDAEVNVGDIRITTATPSYGRVRLEANVGGTRISGDDRIRPVRRSRGYGPGDSMSLDGDGRDRIRLEVNVGNASLRFKSVN